MALPVPKNLGWKLGSLALAFLLWLVTSSEPEVVTTHVAPVIYQNLPDGYMIAGTPPETVRIELRGPTGELTPTALDPLAVTFDLANAATPSSRTLTVSNTDVGLPRGVSFLRAIPSQLQIRLAKIETREVPVSPQFEGELPPGYHIASFTVLPDKLQIAGSDTRVGAVRELKTEVINLASALKTPAYRVNAVIDDPQVHFTSSSAVTVKLSVEPLKN